MRWSVRLRSALSGSRARSCLMVGVRTISRRLDEGSGCGSLPLSCADARFCRDAARSAAGTSDGPLTIKSDNLRIDVLRVGVGGEAGDLPLPAAACGVWSESESRGDILYLITRPARPAINS